MLDALLQFYINIFIKYRQNKIVQLKYYGIKNLLDK